MLKPTLILVLSGKETLAQIKRAGVDWLELRADLLPQCTPEALLKKISQLKPLHLPILLTVRNQREQGAPRIFPDQEKWAIMEAGLGRVDMVDIELTSPLLKPLMALAHRLKKKAMVSSHFFKLTPPLEQLELLLRQSKAVGADYVKIAALAQHRDDLWRLLQFTYTHRDEFIVSIAMGEQGKLSRLVFPLMGSRFAYTYIGSPKAPGQVEAKTLRELIGGQRPIFTPPDEPKFS